VPDLAHCHPDGFLVAVAFVVVACLALARVAEAVGYYFVVDDYPVPDGCRVDQIVFVGYFLPGFVEGVVDRGVGFARVPDWVDQLVLENCQPDVVAVLFLFRGACENFFPDCEG
jgi:hypothetical protein